MNKEYVCPNCDSTTFERTVTADQTVHTTEVGEPIIVETDHNKLHKICCSKCGEIIFEDDVMGL